MPIPRLPNYPDYNATKNIPVIFAGKTLEKFYAASTVANIATTDYVGEIKNQGDTVWIRTVPSITIKPYKKGQRLELEYPESTYVEFTVNRAKYYNFALDDIDIKQFDLNMMDKYAQDASQQLKIVYDREVFGTIYVDVDENNRGPNAGKQTHAFNLGETGSPLEVTKNNIIDLIVDMGTVLDEQDRPRTDRYIVLPPKIAGLIKKSELKDASLTGDRQSVLRSGLIGRIDDFDIYISNLLPIVEDGGSKCTYIYFGHKSALVFVMQLVKEETYRPPDTFAEAMKGLVVYDFKVLQPASLGVAYVKLV
ncbi:MAG: hypothetical protein DRH57_00275 [Candidatus Cloacimonadota bacterium]|nr:MAG: hypothetical protein DRH57_00275 [Candidatus Cloacimonadota bacterium]